MENAKIKNMYDLSQSIAGEYLSQFTYPWEALKGISDFIKKLGPTLCIYSRECDHWKRIGCRKFHGDQK